MESDSGNMEHEDQAGIVNEIDRENAGEVGNGDVIGEIADEDLNDELGENVGTAAVERDLTIFTNNWGRAALVLDGFVFRRMREIKGVVYCHCEKTSLCKVSFMTDVNHRFLRNGLYTVHNHAIEPLRVPIAVAFVNNALAGQVVLSVKSQQRLERLEIASRMGKQRTLARRVQRSRQSARDPLPLEPNSLNFNFD